MYTVKRGNRVLGTVLGRRGWDKSDALNAARAKYGQGVNVSKTL